MAEKIVNGKTAAALLAGAFVGVGVAILFAPQSGRQTRRSIRLFAERVGNQVGAVELQMQRSVNHIIRDAEDKISRILNQSKNWTEAKMTEIRKVFDSVRNSAACNVEKIKAA